MSTTCDRDASGATAAGAVAGAATATPAGTATSASAGVDEGCVAGGSGAVPGVESFARLAGVDPWALDAASRLKLVAEFERHAGWFEALRADVLAAAAGPGPEFGPQPDDADCEGFRAMYAVEDAVADEVSLVMRMSGVSTKRRMAVARDLHYKLPVTARLLRAGVCSYGHAAVISDECDRLSVVQARAVEAGALDRVGVQTPGQTRRRVRAFIARLFPEGPGQPDEDEFARRSVSMSFDGSVMATITATLPAPDAIVVWNALTACARAGAPLSPSCATVTTASTTIPGAAATSGTTGSAAGVAGAGAGAGGAGVGGGVPDRRTMAHKRADALTAWAYRAGDDPGLPVMQGKKRLEAQVVIDVATLLGFADTAAELVGYGPIPAWLGRRLGGHAGSWRRLVTDPVGGHLLDYGTTRYTPPARLREYVLARDRVCQFPTCQRTGYQCDLDHVEAFTGTD
ncbi:MAG: DUF222 domain-containing protein, partial [Candidatus Nanopelagicales bacterium]